MFYFGDLVVVLWFAPFRIAAGLSLSSRDPEGLLLFFPYIPYILLYIEDRRVDVRSWVNTS